MNTTKLSPPETSNKSVLNNLTSREWEVLLLVAEDITNTQIADTLCLTPESVKTYRARIGDKLMIYGRGELGRYARKNAQRLKEKYQSLYQIIDLSYLK